MVRYVNCNATAPEPVWRVKNFSPEMPGPVLGGYRWKWLLSNPRCVRNNVIYCCCLFPEQRSPTSSILFIHHRTSHITATLTLLALLPPFFFFSSMPPFLSSFFLSSSIFSSTITTLTTTVAATSISTPPTPLVPHRKLFALLSTSLQLSVFRSAFSNSTRPPVSY